jgi:tetratricopeptide (TPR) repeat protein
MFRWLVRLFYRKKVRRIESMSRALQLIGEKDLRGAGALIQECRPTEFLEDLSLYYFVRGRFHLECLELEAAECYLNAAFALGFRRPALFLSLGLCKARLRRLGEAFELLTLARRLSAEDEEKQILDALLKLIDEVRTGRVRSGLEALATNAGARLLGRRGKPGEWRKADWQKLLDAGVFMDDAPTEPTDEMIVLLGTWLIETHRGVWEYGLEPADLAVRVQDVAFSPLHLIRSVRTGALSREELEKLPMSASVPRFYEESALS